MLVLNREQVEALLDRDALLAALTPAMVELSAGRVSMPQRVAAQVPEAPGLLGVMPAYLPASRTLSCKLVSVFPNNAERALPTHQAALMLFDADTGGPLAVMDAASITTLRTAAGSALATRLLAREDAAVLLILGSGVQAKAHGLAVARVRQLKEIRVAGRNPQRAGALSRELGERLQVKAQALSIGPDAFRGADIVCATTHAEEPVVKGAWLAPGMHVNSVGLNQKGREVDAEAVKRALVVVESRPAALAPPPSGANELVGAAIHAEIGEILAGSRPGRSGPAEITLYKSVGVALQDAVAARLAYDTALERGVGLEVGF